MKGRQTPTSKRFLLASFPRLEALHEEGGSVREALVVDVEDTVDKGEVGIQGGTMRAVDKLSF